MGCDRSGQSLMPMRVGQTWTYQVTGDFQVFVEPISVNRRIAVGSTDGYELTGPLGVSRLAWLEDKLVTSATANARFSPPIPILLGHGTRGRWEGQVGWMGSNAHTVAILTQDNSKVRVGGRSVNAVRSTLQFTVRGHPVELASWFQPGVGLILQEQRVDGHRNLKMEMLQ